MNSNNMILEGQSPFGFQETVDRLSRAIENRGWKTPALHDLQQTMKSFGKEVLPVKVFEICHPAHSGRILEKDAERIVSVMMPCRISVFERSDGKTYVTRINAGTMAEVFGGLIQEVMTDATAEVEEIIIDALNVSS